MPRRRLPTGGASVAIRSSVQWYRAAREADLLFPLDQAARLTAVGMASRHGIDAGTTRIFVNSNPSSIYDPAFCLRSTIAAIAQTPRLTPGCAGASLKT